MNIKAIIIGLFVVVSCYGGDSVSDLDVESIIEGRDSKHKMGWVQGSSNNEFLLYDNNKNCIGSLTIIKPENKTDDNDIATVELKLTGDSNTLCYEFFRILNDLCSFIQNMILNDLKKIPSMYKEDMEKYHKLIEDDDSSLRND